MPFLSCKGGVGFLPRVRTCLLCVNSHFWRLHCTSWMWSRWLVCIFSQWPPSGGQILLLCSWTAQERVGWVLCHQLRLDLPVNFSGLHYSVRLLSSSLQHTSPEQLMPHGHSDIRCLCVRFARWLPGHWCLLLQS